MLNHFIDADTENPGSTFSARELNSMYVDQLKAKGIKESINTTRFTKRLVENIPELYVETVDNKTQLVFKKIVKELVTDYVKSPDDFFLALRRVVSPLRKEIGKLSNKFNGSFSNFSQFSSVPLPLLHLISMLINGFCPTDNNFTQESLSIAQIIMWNFRKSGNKKADGQLVKRCYHEKTRETPMMIYIGLKIYSTSRSRNLIDMLFNLGLCISYDRVLEITKNIYENLREAYENNKFFFPNILKLGLFTVMLKDNIDFNSKLNLINGTIMVQVGL